MSGSTHVEIVADVFLLGLTTPCIQFRHEEEERRFHQEHKVQFQKDLEAIKEKIESLLADLKINHAEQFAFQKYGKDLPEVTQGQEGKAGVSGACRYLLTLSHELLSGIAWIEIGFRRLPDKEATETLKTGIGRAVRAALSPREWND